MYEDSKYVLTSPRSLEACAKVGVKVNHMQYKQGVTLDNYPGW